jgi:uncharacterized membrane protein
MDALTIILGLAFTIFYLYVGYRIVDKAGFNGLWVLTTLVPLLNIIMVIIFAFKPWPAVEGTAAKKDGFQAPPPSA